MILHQNPDTGYWNVLGDGDVVLRTHEPDQCGDFCAVHNRPSDHALKDAPLNWRVDRGILERICEHGVGHPDVDSAAYLDSIGLGYENVHGCDYCCHVQGGPQ